MPGADDEHIVDLRVLLLDRLIGLESAVEIFGVVPAADDHYGWRDVFQMLSDVPLFPKIIAIGMRHHVIPKWRGLFEQLFGHVLHIARFEKKLVAIGR